MDPLDSLKVADKLKSSSDEAERRTAVSRAYYAVYHHIKAYLVANSIPDQLLGHKKLVSYLRNSGIEKAETLGEIVDDLREDRNKADYKLHLTIFNKKTCDTFCRRAQKVVKDFDSCKGSSLINGINDHRKKIDDA